MTHNTEKDWNPNEHQGRTYKQYKNSARESFYAFLALLLFGGLGLIYWIFTLIGIIA